MSSTILRLKSGMDKLQPSTNAISVSNLFRLGTLLANTQYISLAKATINAFESEILQHPWLFVSLLTGVVAAKLGVKEVKVAAGDEEALRNYYTLPRAEARVLFLVDGGKQPESLAPVPEAKDEMSTTSETKATETREENQAKAELSALVADTPSTGKVGAGDEPTIVSESVAPPEAELTTALEGKEATEVVTQTPAEKATETAAT